MPGSLAIGVDAGGTKVEALLVDVGRDGAILERKRAETPAVDPEAIVTTIVDAASTVGAGRADVVAVGIGAAGMVTLDGVMAFAPNLAWRDVPLAGLVAERLELPTVVENDANAAAWGEYRFGAGRESEHMLLLTVGTGIGGGIVLGGCLYRGAHGFAAEVGHIIVEPGGPRCGCGNLGCWEQVASGRAIDRLGRQVAAHDPTGAIARMAGGAGAVRGPVVTRAAREGDAAALGVLAEVARRFGEGIAGLVNVLDPDLVVVGGGVVEAGDLFLEPARRAFRQSLEAPDRRPPVPLVPAELGNAAGAVGAADLALRAVRERGA